MLIWGVLLALCLLLNVVCLFSENRDAIISNGATLTLYTSVVGKTIIGKLHSKRVAELKALMYDGTLHELWNKVLVF